MSRDLFSHLFAFDFCVSLSLGKPTPLIGKAGLGGVPETGKPKTTKKQKTSRRLVPQISGFFGFWFVCFVLLFCFFWFLCFLAILVGIYFHTAMRHALLIYLPYISAYLESRVTTISRLDM